MNPLNYMPTFNYVLLKRHASQTETPGGLYIPVAAQSSNEIATVIAVGPGLPQEGGKVIPVPFEKGQVVRVEDWHGIPIRELGEGFIMIPAGKIIAVLIGADPQMPEG